MSHRQLLVFAIAAMFIRPAVADDLPDQIELTNESAAALGFSIETIEPDQADTMVVLRFPSRFSDGRLAARVQSALFDPNGKQVSIHSSDYLVGGGIGTAWGAPSVMSAFPPDYDLAFAVQFTCAEPTRREFICEAFQVRSVKKFLKNSSKEKKTPSNERVQ